MLLPLSRTPRCCVVQETDRRTIRELVVLQESFKVYEDLSAPSTGTEQRVMRLPLSRGPFACDNGSAELDGLLLLCLPWALHWMGLCLCVSGLRRRAQFKTQLSDVADRSSSSAVPCLSPVCRLSTAAPEQFLSPFVSPPFAILRAQEDEEQ